MSFFSFLLLISLFSSNGWYSILCKAAVPLVMVNGDQPQAQIDRTHEAIRDAFQIARIAALTFCPGDAAFLRYFRPQDGPFVQNVFRTLANIPLDKVLTGADVVDYITTPDLQNLSPLLGQVFVRLEDDPEHFCSSNPRANAYMGYDNPGQAANIYLCDLAYSWPSIEEIVSPPQTPWARDPVGRPLPGYSCANLGDHDSDWMKTPGSIILHELLHWGFFFASVPSWKSTIVYKNSEWKILDYKGQAGPPPNGYGPYNAKMLKDEFSTTDQVWPETLNNVENYVWFAVSKYWSWRCEAVFGPAQSDDDAHRREDSGYRPKWP